MQRESIANIRGIAKVLQLSIPTATGAQNKLAHIGIVDELQASVEIASCLPSLLQHGR